MVYKLKNDFKQSMTKQVRNRAADRDSDPYRDGGWYAPKQRELLNCEKDKAPATTVVARDKSGLPNMGKNMAHRAGDQYKAVAEQQAKLRQQRLQTVLGNDNVDPKEFAQYLISIRRDPAEYGYGGLV